MKKSLLYVIIILTVVSTSCDKELCYDCKKGQDYSKFCLPRGDAKDKKKSLENAGYNCSKFKQ